MYKEDIEESKRRIEAWWNHEIIDRAVLLVTAPRKQASADESKTEPPRETGGDAVERGFTDPEVVIPRSRDKLANTYFGGESFPVMYPVYGGMVAILANYLGCPMRFVDKNTVWSEPILDDWDHRPEFRCDLNNKYWQMSERLLKAGVEQADGYYVGVPDLNGPTEILSRLRSPQRLAIDFIDNPEHIKPALAEINQAWYAYWRECTKITERIGGYFYWMGIWSDLPSIDLQSDFSCMISTEMFDEYLLPFIEEQTTMVERTIYHLDGPGAIRHLDSLLRLPHLSGIQWVPGAGAKPMVEWIPLLKKIQDAGKLIVAGCAKASVRKLLQELNPEGLLLGTRCDSEDEARKLLQDVEKWTVRRKYK